MVEDSVALPARPRQAGVLRRRALLRRLPPQPRLRPPGPRARPRRPGPRPWCSATPTGARSPTTSARRWPAFAGGPTPSSASTATTTPGVRWPTRSSPSRPGSPRCRAASTATASAAGNADLSAAIPNLSLKLNIRTIPAERLERLTPVSHHIAELVNIAPDPQQPYVGSSVFAHKGGLHASAVARRRDLYEHDPPRGRGQRHPGGRLGDGRSLHAGHEGGRARLRPRRRGPRPRARRAEAPRARGLPLRGGRRLARAAVARGPAAGSRTTSPSSRSGSSPTTARARRTRAGRPRPRPRSRSTWATERVVATAEGNGPVNALDAALRQAIGPHFPALAGVHLTDYRVRVLDTGPGDRGGHPGARRHHRRRADLDDHRGLGEHHRGQLAGALRLDRLRPAARRGRRRICLTGPVRRKGRLLGYARRA